MFGGCYNFTHIKSKMLYFSIALNKPSDVNSTDFIAWDWTILNKWCQNIITLFDIPVWLFWPKIDCWWSLITGMHLQH